ALGGRLGKADGVVYGLFGVQVEDRLAHAVLIVGELPGLATRERKNESKPAESAHRRTSQPSSLPAPLPLFDTRRQESEATFALIGMKRLGSSPFVVFPQQNLQSAAAGSPLAFGLSESQYGRRSRRPRLT